MSDFDDDGEHDDRPYLTDGKTWTSREAGESIKDDVGRLEGVVLDAIRGSPTGLPCFEVERVTGLCHETASARITGLRQKKLIQDSGRWKLTPRNRKAIVWIPVKAQLEIGL